MVADRGRLFVREDKIERFLASPSGHLRQQKLASSMGKTTDIQRRHRENLIHRRDLMATPHATDLNDHEANLGFRFGRRAISNHVYDRCFTYVPRLSIASSVDTRHAGLARRCLSIQLELFTRQEHRLWCSDTGLERVDRRLPSDYFTPCGSRSRTQRASLVAPA